MREINEEQLEQAFNTSCTDSEIEVIIAELFLSIYGNNESKKQAKQAFGFLELESIEALSIKEIVPLIEELGLSLFYSNPDFRNKDFKKLVYMVQEKIDTQIGLKMSKYSKEEVLINCILFSSIMSKVTLSIYSKETTKEKRIDSNLNILSDMFRKYEKSDFLDMREFLAIIKKPIELCVSYLLDSSCECSKSNTQKKVNIKELIILFHAKLHLIHITGSIPLMGEYRTEFICNDTQGIQLPEQLYEAYNQYTLATKGEYVDTENVLTNELFKEFKKKFYFKPSDLLQYFLSDNTEVMLYETLVNKCDKELFKSDLENKTKLLKEGVDNIIDSLVLNKLELEEIELDELTMNPNLRLFRAPIIELKTSYLIPTYTLFESFHFFQYRILNRDLFYIENEKNWNELIKTKYDEFYLPLIESRLKSSGNKYKEIRKNLDFGKEKEIKGKLEGIKGMPHEIDLCYIDSKGILHIKDLKNYGIQHSLTDVNKTVQKLKKDIRKLKKLKLFILDNKMEFESILGYRIKDVNIGVITVNLTAYNFFDFSKNNESIEVLSIKEFEKRI